MDWDLARTFLAACRARTLADAGRRVGIDLSTVSRRLTALEGELGARLFTRGREGLSPTDAALELLPVAEEMEHAMARFSRAADALERSISGLVRVTCPPDVAEVIVVPAIERVRARHPSLRIDVEPSETILDLSRREADIALRTVPPLRGDLVMTKLARAPWVVCAAPSLAKKIAPLGDLSTVAWITFGDAMAHLPAARWLAAHARDVVPRMTSSSLSLQLAMVRAGGVVALAPRPSVAHFGLAEVPLKPALAAAARALPENDLLLVTHRALRDVPRVRVVWDALAQQTAALTPAVRKKRPQSSMR